MTLTRRIQRLGKHAVARCLSLLGGYPISLHGRRLWCNAENAWAWRSVARGTWEPGTAAALDRFLQPGAVLCDVGAWIGQVTLYAAHRCSKVYCFEPDYVAYERLLRNLRNKGLGHVHPFNLALSNDSGVLTMRPRNEELGDCTSTLLLPRSPESIDVLSVSWADWLRLVQPNPITFIKIDIEGAEFDLIPTMLDYLRMYKPVVHLSLHARFLPADKQRAALDSIYGQLMSIYPDCLDEHFQRLDLAGFHTANQPPSPAVVFAPAS